MAGATDYAAGGRRGVSSKEEPLFAGLLWFKQGEQWT